MLTLEQRREDCLVQLLRLGALLPVAYPKHCDLQTQTQLISYDILEGANIILLDQVLQLNVG